MNELVAPRDSNRAVAERKRLRALATKISAGNGGPDDLIVLANRLRDGRHNLRFWPNDQLRALVVGAEAKLGEPGYKAFLRELTAAAQPASRADMIVEVAELLLCWPATVDLSAFTQLMLDEIAGENPSRLQLAVACRTLRRTAKFRPSIAEMLEALGEAKGALRHVSNMVAISTNLPLIKAAIQQRDQAEHTNDPTALKDERWTDEPPPEKQLLDPGI